MTQSEGKAWDCCNSNFIAIEIIFFLFKIGDSMLDPSVRLFIYQGVCLDNFPNVTTCYNLADFPEQEAVVQAQSASYIMYFKLLLNLPAVFLGFFCGAWSDRVGRKLPVLMSPLGTILGVMCFMLSMMVESGGLALILVGAAIRGMFGKSAVITMALHSYVSDTSDKEERTKMFGKLLAMNFFGYFCGSLMVGALLEVCTFDVIFCAVVFVECFCIIVAVLFMRDSIPPDTDDVTLNSDGLVGGNGKKMPFHWRHVVDSIHVLVRPRDNQGRCHLLLFFFTIIAQQVCKSGETDTTLLFVEKNPLHWNKSMYGFLLATDYACLGIAVFFLLPILIKLLSLGDLSLVLIGLVFKMARLLIMAFSNTTWMVYLSVVIGCPSAMIISGSKSLISKSVHEDEMGKTFSLLSTGETISNLLGTVIFTSMYAATFKLFGGLTFVLDAIFHGLLFVVLFCAAKDLKLHSQLSLLQNILGKKPETVPNYGTTTDEYTPLPINTIHPNSKLPQLAEMDEMESEYEEVQETEAGTATAALD